MKSNFKNIATRSLIGAALLLGVCACTDDHFDVVANETGNGSNTIWRNIEDKPELSDFATVLKRTRVMKDEKDVKSQQTFDDLLNQPQAFTVWAPVNAKYDVQKYLDILDEVDALRQAANNYVEPAPEPGPGEGEEEETDNVTDTDEPTVTPSAYTGEIPEGTPAELLALAAKKEYVVVNQFVRNHIARFNYEGAAGAQDVRMLNAKNSVYSPGLFNGVPMGESVYTSNGTLHFLEGVSPFAYNIFDFIASDAKYSTLYGILSDPSVDRDTFWPAGSTEGAMNENGEMVYVDSVYINTNDILSAANAQIKNEDSTYVALIPTNDAWNEAYATVSALNQYGDNYCYDWDDENGVFLKTGVNAVKFNATQRDSLLNLQTNEMVIKSMFFSPSYYPNVNRNDSAQVVQHTLMADSLRSTTGLYFYNANVGSENPMFAGITPEKASNGYVFPMETYTVNPAYSFLSRQEILSYFSCCSTAGCTSSRGEYTFLDVDNRNDSVKGKFEDDVYTYYEVDGNSKLTIRFRLNNIYSGHYKISVQMAPNRINKYNIRTDEKGDTIVEKPQFSAQLLGDDLKTLSGTKAVTNISVNQDEIEKIVLYEDVLFPKTYVGLPSGYTSFPMLEISMTLAQQKKGNCKALSIGKIVIEPVRE